MIDLEEFYACEFCGTFYHKTICKIKEERSDYYGTDITLQCPVCGTIEEINNGDGMYK